MMKGKEREKGENVKGLKEIYMFQLETRDNNRINVCANFWNRIPEMFMFFSIEK